MKYKTLKEFIAAANAGGFTGSVVIDKDCVTAYEDNQDGEPEEVFNFGGDTPEAVLFDVMLTLGIRAEYP